MLATLFNKLFGIPSTKIGFTFCESTFAGSASPWHIRRLSDAGFKLGGGIDTPSLCGHVRPRNGGWDITAKIDEINLRICCQECAKLFKENENGKSATGDSNSS